MAPHLLTTIPFSHSRQRTATLNIALALVVALVAACSDEEPGTPGFMAVSQCEQIEDCDEYIDALNYHPACVSVSCEDAQCVFTALEEPGVCQDDTACTVGDVCSAGRCKGEEIDCEDGDLCTLDRCDRVTAECTHEIEVGAACADGIECTFPDLCHSDGSCVGLPTDSCACEEDGDCGTTGLPACVASAMCVDYACEPNPDDPVICSTENDWMCGHAACVEEAGGCTLVAQNQGQPCSDENNPCVETGFCEQGACVGPSIDCEDGDPCTFDGCDPQVEGGCVHLPYGGAPCDDGDPCTVEDICQEDGACLGAQGACNDANPCTKDVCDSEDLTCTYVFLEEGVSCDDGDPCSLNDICLGGVCAGVPLVCEDENPCTEDMCVLGDAGTPGCENIPFEGPCEDGNPCTEGDTCVDLTCVSGEVTCQCLTDADCDPFEQEDACLGDLVCKTDVSPYVCVPDPETVPGCPEPQNSCQVAACAPETGICSLVPVTDGTPCDPQDACVLGGACQGGMCVGELKDCADDDPCTGNVCDDGICLDSVLDGGSMIVDASFDAGLPVSWSASSDNANVIWSVSQDYGAIGLGMVATGLDGSYDHGATRAELLSPEFVLKGEQLSLRYQVKAQFQDNSCTADVFTVELLAYGVSTVVGQLCQSLVGFTSFEVDLAPYKNQVAQLRFTFQSDEDNNAGFGVALDEVSVEAVYGCDDGDACTATDLCVQGICQGEAQEPCP